MKHQNSLLADTVKGALAGAAATWVMGQVTTYMYEHEPESARQQEDDARGGKTAYGAAAERAAGAAGAELSDEQRQQAGSAIHWALGAGAGAVYGAMRNANDATDMAHGMVFGTAFWLLMDEIGVAVLGLTPPPAEFPWQTHARGFAGHLVFGLVAETVMDVLDQVA